MRRFEEYDAEIQRLEIKPYQKPSGLENNKLELTREIADLDASRILNRLKESRPKSKVSVPDVDAILRLISEAIKNPYSEALQEKINAKNRGITILESRLAALRKSASPDIEISPEILDKFKEELSQIKTSRDWQSILLGAIGDIEKAGLYYIHQASRAPEYDISIVRKVFFDKLWSLIDNFDSEMDWEKEEEDEPE